MREQRDKSTAAVIPRLFASWFGAGLSPVAPGTVGSIAALPFIYVVLSFESLIFTLMVGLILLFLGVWSGGIAGRQWGQIDHGSIVIDEVLGQLITVAIPYFVVFGSIDTVWLYAVSLVLFRLFDILKPWPVGWFDRHVKNAWGVMLDDVAAGFMAGALAVPPLILLTL